MSPKVGKFSEQTWGVSGERQHAHVRRFRENSGNAGMIARELPSAEVLASWQHIEQRALDLRAAGLPGTLHELRVRAYLDLLQERDSRPAQPGPQKRDGGGGQPDPPEPDSRPTQPDPQGRDGGGAQAGPPEPDSRPAQPGPPEPDNRPAQPDPPEPDSRPAQPDPPEPDSRPVPPGTPDPGPSIAALVTITVSLDTVIGRSAAPGQAAGFGLLDADDARDLIAAAARHRATRWCLTALYPDGTAAAHACIPGPHPDIPVLTTPAASNNRAAGDNRAGPDPPPLTSPDQTDAVLRALRARLAVIARGRCDHRHAQSDYRPSRMLAHLITARSATCTAPGCGRPAARCDLDHTRAWHHGGPTCQCNLAPLCRHHHRCKQAEGWRLDQPEPGILIWRTPAGRIYTTTPTEYPV